MGECIFKRKTGRNGKIVEEGGPSATEEKNSNNQHPKFEGARRAAICSVIEEEDQRNGISLAELRRELIVRYLLINIGLL